MSEHDSNGTQLGKPEWFSLVEADTRIQHKLRDRGFRIMALAGPLLLISTGLLFAQTSEGQDASAIESTSISAPVISGTSELGSSQLVSAPAMGAASPLTPINPDTKLANDGINQGFVAPLPSKNQSLSEDEEDEEEDEEDDDLYGSDDEDDDDYEDEDSDEDEDD